VRICARALRHGAGYANYDARCSPDDTRDAGVYTRYITRADQWPPIWADMIRGAQIYDTDTSITSAAGRRDQSRGTCVRRRGNKWTRLRPKSGRSVRLRSRR